MVAFDLKSIYETSIGQCGLPREVVWHCDGSFRFPGPYGLLMLAKICNKSLVLVFFFFPNCIPLAFLILRRPANCSVATKACFAVIFSSNQWFFRRSRAARSGICDKSLVLAFFFCPNQVPLDVPGHFFYSHANCTTRKNDAGLERVSSARHWCSASADWLRPFHSCGT